MSARWLIGAAARTLCIAFIPILWLVVRWAAACAQTPLW